MKNTEAAYLAGLMDGEGCFYVERFATARSPIGFQYRVMVTITMTDKRTIEYICNLTGKNFRTRKKKDNRRTAYTVDWRNSIAYDLLKIMLPYLQNKKEQAEWCIRFNETLAPGRGKTYTKDQFEKCESFVQKLKELKR